MGKQPKLGLSLRKYAEHRKGLGLPGGSLKGVQNAIARGDFELLPDGSVDPAAADQGWGRNADPDAIVRRDLGRVDAVAPAESAPPVVEAAAPQVPPPASAMNGGLGSGPGLGSTARGADELESPTAELTRWRARHARAQAEQAELERLELQGRLIDAEEVYEAQLVIAQEVRDFLMNIVTEYSPELAARLGTDEKATYAALDEVMNLALQEKSDETAQSVEVAA